MEAESQVIKFLTLINKAIAICEIQIEQEVSNDMQVDCFLLFLGCHGNTAVTDSGDVVYWSPVLVTQCVICQGY